MSNKQWDAGRSWGQRYPNMPAPPKSSPDFGAGVNSGRKGK